MEFLSCGLSKIEYHPGLKALYYFQTQNPEWIMMLIDKGYPATSDPCHEGQEIFKTPANNIRKHADLGTLIRAKFSSSTYILSTLSIRTQDTIFLNEIMFIPVDC